MSLNENNQENAIEANKPSDNAANNENLVLNYTSTNKLYGLALDFQESLSVAVSSIDLNEEAQNFIEIVNFDERTQKLKQSVVTDVPFPCSKLMWSPSVLKDSNILASSSDIIRLYRYNDITNKTELEEICALNNKKSKYCAPLTAFDWNKQNPSILGTASIDTTCTIWDLNKQSIRTQLIAHDKEVFDIAFAQEENIFLSTGADGSIRLFDLRSLDHSTIIYETKDSSPITKIAWNLHNSYYIAAVALDKPSLYIVDSRISMVALELNAHTKQINNMCWAPNNPVHICSVSDDKFVLIWDIQSQAEKLTDGPSLSYQAPHELKNVSWSANGNSEWVGITYDNELQLLKV